MKKSIVILVFLIGLGIFSYPIVSNLLATKEHHTMIGDYHETVLKMESEQLQREKQKANEHNEQLAKSEVDYVDPFSDGTTDKHLQGTKSYYDVLQINPAIGSISIPKINVDLPIYHGTGERALSQGVGHLENSSLPSSEPGIHSVLTAHRGLPSSKLFRHLDDIEIGDKFFVQVLDETLTYEVHDVQIVLPHETDWLKFDDRDNIVTLLTCEPYMINSHRLLVTGHLVPDEEKKGEHFYQSEYESRTNWFLIALLVSFGLLILIGILRYRQCKKEVD